MTFSFDPTATSEFARYRDLVDKLANARQVRLGGQAGDQVRRFSQFLLDRTDWLSAPASSRYHMAVTAGLLVHSLSVVRVALQLADLLAPRLPWDSVALVALWHDVGKVWGRAGRDRIEPHYERNILKSGQQSEAEPYRKARNGAALSPTFLDALLPAVWIDLQEYELQALLGADGQYVPENKTMQQHEHPLTLIVHWADMWCAHVLEAGPDGQALIDRYADWLTGQIRLGQ